MSVLMSFKFQKCGKLDLREKQREAMLCGTRTNLIREINIPSILLTTTFNIHIENVDGMLHL